MTSMDAKGSRIRDAVRDSKIHWDIHSKFDRKIELQYNLQPDFSHDGRVFPRSCEGDDSKGFGRVGRELHGSPSAGDGRRNIVREVNRRWIRSYIPIFNGTSNRKDLLEWVEIVDRFFEEVRPPENLKCKLAYYALEGEAELWWRNMQHQRLLKGASKIKIWPWMKYLLFTDFKPATCSTKCSFQVYNRRQSVNGVGKYPNESYNGTGNTAIQKTFATGNHMQQMMAGVILPTKCSTKLLVESASIKQAQNKTNIYDIEGKAYMKGGHDYSNEPHSTIADASAKGTQAIENMVAQIMDMKLETVKVDDHPHEEVKIESYNVEKECSIHEVVDGEMSSTKQCIKTIALACPHSESNKVEEKSTDELIEDDLAESRGHPNAMLGQLKKGVIEGHVMETEHNLTVTIKVLNDVSETSSAYFALTDVSKLDRPLKYDSPTHVLPIDPPKLLEKMILKLLVKGLVEKCSSKAVRIESQLGRATKIGKANDEQYRSQIHLEPKDINFLVGKTLMFNFDPGGARNNQPLRNCWKAFIVNKQVCARNNQPLRNCWKAFIVNKQVCVARYYAFFVSKLQFMNGETLSLTYSPGGKLQTEPKAHERPVQKLEFALGWIYVLKMARKVYVIGFDNNWKDGKNQFDRFLIWFRVLEAMDFISPTKLYLCSNGEWIWYLFIAGWLRLIRILVREQHFQDFIDICFTIISSLMPHLMVIFGILCIYCPIEVQVHVIPGLVADRKNPSLQKRQSYNEPLSRVLLLTIILCLTKPEEVLLVDDVLVLYRTILEAIVILSFHEPFEMPQQIVKSTPVSMDFFLSLRPAKQCVSKMVDVIYNTTHGVHHLAAQGVLGVGIAFFLLLLKGYNTGSKVANEGMKEILNYFKSGEIIKDELVSTVEEYDGIDLELAGHRAIFCATNAAMLGTRPSTKMHGLYTEEASSYLGFVLTRGRVISWEGWNDENNSDTEGKFISIKLNVVTISTCLSIWCVNGQLRETLKLFYKVVNGLDPPMALDSVCGASKGISMSSLVDELLRRRNGDDALSLQDILKMRVIFVN